MIKAEVETLLLKNGYKKHPIFDFYSIPKQNLGHYFYVKEDITIVGKIKWGNIALNESKEIRTRSFNPHNFNLITDLDIKMKVEVAKRMAVNRAKHLAAKGKGYSEVVDSEEETPTAEPPKQA